MSFRALPPSPVSGRSLPPQAVGSSNSSNGFSAAALAAQGIELPPGAVVNPDGRVFLGDTFLGVVETLVDDNRAPPPEAQPSNADVSVQAVQEISVVDAAPFGYPGLAIGPDGRMYNQQRQCVGILDGYVEQFGSSHPPLPVPHPHVSPPPPGVAVDDVNLEEKKKVEPGQAPPQQSGNMFRALPARADPQPRQQADNNNNNNNNVVIDQDNNVYDRQSGQLVGKMMPDGTITGMPGVSVADEHREAVQNHVVKARQLTKAEKLAKLLYVPQYHNTGTKTADAYVLEQKAEAAKSKGRDKEQEPYGRGLHAPIVEVAEEPALLEIEEPGDGLVKMDVNPDFFEKKRGMLREPQNFVPSRFTRPFLHPDFPQECKLMDPQQLAYPSLDVQQQFKRLRFVWLAELNNERHHFTRSQLRNLPRTFARMPNLEVLGIRNSGLTELALTGNQKLLRLDVRYNQFKSYKNVLHMVEHCPQLQILDVAHNPIVQRWDTFLPPKKNDMWRVILACPQLGVFNEKFITNPERHAALERFGSRQQKREYPEVMYHQAMNSIPAVAQMLEWDPTTIVSLNLRNQSLSTINLTGMIHLEELNLADNFIDNVRTGGFHLCPELHSLDLSNNRITVKELPFFVYIPNLRRLHLGLGFKNRGHVVFATRFLKGDNRSTGLLWLDGHRVTIEERVHAVAAQNPKHEHIERWFLNLIRLYGHYQLRKVKYFVIRTRNLRLPDSNLAWADVGPYTGLKVLNLAKNRLRTVVGLEKLAKLISLDLSGNANLDIKATLKQLAQLTALQQVALAPTVSANKPKFLAQVAKALVPTNTRLTIVDGTVLTVEHRLAVFKDTFSKGRLEEYKINLALVMSSTPEEGRRYAPEDVKPGPQCQYRATEVRELMMLGGLGIRSANLRLGEFVNVVQLNLADNELADITNIGLEAMHKLQWLDLRNNKISMRHDKLGPVIDSMPSLKVIALRGNPCMRRKKDRVSLIMNIKQLRNVTCKLRIIDDEITIDERIKAMEKAGMTRAEAEVLRSRTALHIRAPDEREVPPDKLTRLNMDRMELSVCDLSAFVNLEVLRLRGNRFEEMKGIGLRFMPNLRVLDMRDNRLSDPAEIVQVISGLLRLEYAGFSGNKLDSTYRQVLLGSVPQLRNMDCPFTWLDDEEITVDEIARAWQANKGRPDRIAVFRFDSIVYRRLKELGIKDPSEANEFDLSNANLTAVDLNPFQHVRRLNLEHNRLTWNRLNKGSLLALQACEELNLSHNDLDGPDAFDFLALAIQRLKSLTHLLVTHNGVCPDNGVEARQHFLSHVKGVEEQSLQLQTLNGAPITVAERVAALRHRERHHPDPEEEERVRLVLTLEEIGATVEMRVMQLSNRQLVSLTALRQFQYLEKLDLSHNNIKTIRAQGLETIPHLEEINLSFNRLTNLDETLTVLSHFDRLRALWLQDALAAHKPYAEAVEEQLLGVHVLDGKEIEKRLTAEQEDAASFLYGLAGIGRNSLVSVDLRNLHIPERFFFFVLAALQVINRTVSLRYKGNDLVENYRTYATAALVRTIKRLDGEIVTQDERLNALKVIDKERDNGIEQLKPWAKVRDKAMSKLSDYKPQARANVKKKLIHAPAFIDFHVPERGAAYGAAGGAGAAGGGAGAARGDADDANGGGDGQDGGGGDAQVQGAGMGQAGVAQVAVGDLRKAAHYIRILTGSFINKVEIAINFLQIYGLILVIDLDVPWPSAFLDFSIWVRMFTFDIENIWSWDLRWQQQVKFAAAMAIPLLCAIFYIGLGVLDQAAWIDRYITKWERTRRRVNMTYMVLLGLTLVCGLLYSASYEEIVNGRAPTTESIGFVTLGATVWTVMYLLWWIIVRSFRKHRLSDHSASHNQFFEWWLRRIFFLRRMSLFMLTIFFLPVARVILSQFQCECVNAAGEVVSSSLFGPDVPAAGETCGIKPFRNEQACLFDEVSVLQYIAFAFLCLYIIGLPIFFYVLVKRGIHQMVDIHGYKDEEERVEKLCENLKDKKEIKKQRKGLKEFYYSKVVSHKLPQTYLYAPYERRYRYFKIVNMFEKLSLVVITVFVPEWAIATLKLIAANALVGLFAFTGVVSKPFNDGLENFLDISARVANTINIFVAVGLKEAFVGSELATYLLFGFNGVALFAFSLAFLASPMLYCYARIRYSEQRDKDIRKQRMRQQGRTSKAVVSSVGKGGAAAGVIALKPQNQQQQPNGHHHHHHNHHHHGGAVVQTPAMRQRSLQQKHSHDSSGKKSPHMRRRRRKK